MRAFLMTRGYAQQDDYMFVGQDPAERWWEAYEKYTNLEKRGLIAWSDGTAWRVLVSGLPTKRRDVVNTPIRNLLVLDGSCARIDDDGVALVNHLVEVWLEDLVDNGERVARRLDAAFPEIDIPGLLVGNDTAAHGRAEERIHAVLRDLAERAETAHPESAPIEAGASWVGTTADEEDRSRFTRAVHALLSGASRGVAGYFNLVRSNSFATRAAEALLAATDGSVSILADLPAREEVPHSPKVTPRRPTRISPLVVAALLMGGLGLVILLIWLVIRLRQIAGR